MVPEGSWIPLRQVFITRLKEQRYPTRGGAGPRRAEASRAFQHRPGLDAQLARAAAQRHRQELQGARGPCGKGGAGSEDRRTHRPAAFALGFREDEAEREVAHAAGEGRSRGAVVPGLQLASASPPSATAIRVPAPSNATSDSRRRATFPCASWFRTAFRRRDCGAAWSAPSRRWRTIRCAGAMTGCASSAPRPISTAGC